MDPSTLTLGQVHFNTSDVWLVLNPVLNANSVDPDQTPRSAASDRDVHCLPMSILRDVRHKYVSILHSIQCTTKFI